MKIVSRITRNYEGFFIGFRTWTFKAFDENNNLICEVSKWEDNNYIKYVRFLNKLRHECGYDVTEAQRKELKSEPFLLPQFIPYVKKEHLVQIANMSGYDVSFLDNIKKKTQEEKNKFAYDVGLEENELEQVIQHFSQ